MSELHDREMARRDAAVERHHYDEMHSGVRETTFLDVFRYWFGMAVSHRDKIAERANSSTLHRREKKKARDILHVIRARERKP